MCYVKNPFTVIVLSPTRFMSFEKTEKDLDVESYETGGIEESVIDDPSKVASYVKSPHKELSKVLVTV